MNCKRCGNEIVGEIQRYCNDCKRELNGEPKEKAAPKKSFKKEKSKIEIEEVKKVEEIKETQKETDEVKEIEMSEDINEVEVPKRNILVTLGYILLMLIIMITVFLGSVVVGFSIGPVLSF